MPTKKASFNLPEEDLAELRRLAAEKNVSVTYALRQAIADSVFLQDEVVRPGRTLSVEDEAGTQRQITIIR